MRRMKAEGLAHNTYFISSGGEAVVIDPRREAGDIENCMDLARGRCTKIKYILETHRNEDFTIGSVDLKKRTGAKIGHSANTPFTYGDIALKEGDSLPFGDMMLNVLETPGHTCDSLTYVLHASDGIPLAAFTGDALFIGSTGRIDLPGKDVEEKNARALYHSIHDKILPSGDHVLLYPAHGAGSVCGVGISDRDESTLGYERMTNAQLSMDEDTFVKTKLEEKFVRPTYFRKMEQYNLHGPPLLESRMKPEALSLAEFKGAVRDRPIVDTRTPPAFGGGHIPGSYSIWLEGMTLFPGWLLDYDRETLLLTDRDEDVKTADKFLARLGYDKCCGYLCGGFDVWQNAGMPIEYTHDISVEELNGRLAAGDITLTDVREPAEWERGIVPGAAMTFVGHLPQRLPDLPRNKPIATMCSVGHRGSIGASILERAGYTNVYNVLGGFKAWKNKGYAVTTPKVTAPKPEEAVT
ncbi:rhodanese-like domain-containing protein [Methanocella paludicola]|nr:rhodanese-like domain-containing protein [Methanocella paludicola]